MITMDLARLTISVATAHFEAGILGCSPYCCLKLSAGGQNKELQKQGQGDSTHKDKCVLVLSTRGV